MNLWQFPFLTWSSSFVKNDNLKFVTTSKPHKQLSSSWPLFDRLVYKTTFLALATSNSPVFTNNTKQSFHETKQNININVERFWRVEKKKNRKWCGGRFHVYVMFIKHATHPNPIELNSIQCKWTHLSTVLASDSPVVIHSRWVSTNRQAYDN